MKDYATFIRDAREAHVAEGGHEDQLEPHLVEWYEAYVLDEQDREERAAEAARQAHIEANPGCAPDGQSCDWTCEAGYRDFVECAPNPGCLTHRRADAAHWARLREAQADDSVPAF